MHGNLKELFGFVETPENLVNELIKMIPPEVFKDESSKWLDPGCGNGAITKCIVDNLTKELDKSIDEVCRNNVYMVETNPFFIPTLKAAFGVNANIYDDDFLLYSPETKFDVIVSNPPYNLNGLKTIPKKRRTTSKWTPIWHSFLNKSLDLLKEGGYMSIIVPASWLKYDESNMYNTLTQYKIHKMICYNSYESYKIFSKKVQIPCTMFVLQKIPTDFVIPIMDNVTGKYVEHRLSVPFRSIPMKNISILNKLAAYSERYGSLSKYIIVSPLPARKFVFKDESTHEYCYKNIKSCTLENGVPEMKYCWSKKPGPFHCLGLPKLVLAHSVYGFPYYDEEGLVGVANRGKFIFLGNNQYLKHLSVLLNLKTIKFLYTSTQYRMRFLDKSVYDFIPDFSIIPGFSFQNISDEYFCDFFQLSSVERKAILETKLYKKEPKIELEVGDLSILQNPVQEDEIETNERTERTSLIA